MYAGCAAHFRCYVDSVVLSRVQEAAQCIVDFFRGRVARLNLARIIPGTPEWHTALRYFTALSDQPAWGLAASAMIQSYESFIAMIMVVVIILRLIQILSERNSTLNNPDSSLDSHSA